LQRAEDAFPNSFASPAVKPSPHRVRFAEPLGQIAPRGARLRNPENGIYEESIVFGGHSWIACLAGQEILDAFPMFI
jgi:hypothetical protein